MKNQIVRNVLLLLFVWTNTEAQISGTVFRDFNGNGTKESGEPLVAGILVKAYDATGAQCGTTQTTNSAAAPNYSLGGCSGQVRIEFEIPASGCLVANTIDFTALNASVYGSSVQFVSSNSTNINFSIHYPGEYVSNSNPHVYTAIHWNGDPSIPAVGSAAAMKGWPYSNVQKSPVPDKEAIGSLIGSTYGLAYSRQAQKMFSSAYIKRHVGLGPLGAGGIYLIDPSSSTMGVSNFFDIDNPSNPLLSSLSSVPANPSNNTTGTPAYGAGSSYNVSGLTITYPSGGLGVVGVNGSGGRSLSSTLTGASNDPAAFDQVGKVGLGDLDISDDGKYLFVTNLYDRKIYRLELDNPTNPTQVITVNSYSLPLISCTNGELRPFALSYHRGTLYVGSLCTGENGGTPSNLDGYIFEIPNATAGGAINNTPVFQFPLDFNRGNSFSENESFVVWTNTMKSGAPRTWNSQPMFTDIEVDIDGSFIIGIRDRNGDQIGHFNRELTGSTLRDARAVGEILRAYKVPGTCTYEFENNGKAGLSSPKAATAGAGNGEGPGGGEFYFEDNVYNASTGLDAQNHANVTQGGLAILPGSGNVMTTAMDPVGLWSNGVSLFDNTNGENIADYEIVLSNSSSNDGTQSKGNGLGDIELAATPAPIEIGNRVWNDTDNDGVQDPGEAAISGVSVQLVKSGSVIATAVTNTNGNYYFSSATGTNTGHTIYGITQLMPNMAYTVRIPNVGTQTPLSGLSPTTANTGGAGQPDVRDSDGATVGANVEASITTTDLPVNGANNHTFDFGFGSAPPPTGGGDCYAVADNGNNPQLYRIDCMTGASTYVGPLSITQDVEAIELSPSYTNLYGIAAQAGFPAAFGSINKSTGAWTQIGLIGSADGALGTISPVEMDGMTHDEFGNMWTISNSPQTAVLLKLDTTTGAVVQNTFGAGIDYLKITGDAENMSIEDMAYDVTTGKYYIVGNGTGATPNSKLYELNVVTGVTTEVADFVQCNEDIEGLTVTPTGELKGTSGNGGNGGPNNPVCMDKFYHLTFTGGVTEVSDIDPTNTHTDFEAMTCPGAPLATMTCTADATVNSTVCNNNGTAGISTDDWFTLNITGTVTGGSGNYVVKIGAYTSPSTPSGTARVITGNGASGNPLLQANGTATYTVRIEDANNSNCFTTTTVGPVNACSSCPSPNCKTVTVTKS